MIRILKSLCLSLIALYLPIMAQAGDFAQFRPLGFSPDGRYFAFEQFGIQDGSGFAYAEHFIIDTHEDQFVGGSPFKLRQDDENISIEQTRAELKEMSQSAMDDLQIGAEPGRITAFNPNTELSSSQKRLTFRESPFEPALDPPYFLELNTYGIEASGICADLGLEIKGFQLKLSRAGAPKIIYADNSVPNSRNCPIDYRIGGVMSYGDFNSDEIHIFLISVISHGFEGPDGRWIAIPYKAP